MKLLPLLLMLVCANVLLAQITDVNDLPENQVAQILANPTVFADDNYTTTTWQQFINSEMANTIIDAKHMDYGLLNAAVFYYTNKYREEHGLPLLQFSKELRNAAIYHSLEMVNRNFFDHENPRNRKMRDPDKRIRYFGFQVDQADGENIATEFLLDAKAGKKFYSTKTNSGYDYYYGNGRNSQAIGPITYGNFAKNIVQDWINSPPHRANLRERRYKFLGCGVIPNFRSGTANQLPEAYGTQDFGG